MAYEGGYLLHREPLMRGGMHKHTAALDNPMSPAALAALNTLQETPWRVNRWLLEVLREAWSNGLPVPGVPLSDNPPLPRVPDEEWAAMSKDERGAHKARREDIYDQIAELEGRRLALLDVLSVASEFADQPAIYFPHFADFRGRLYPLTSAGPTPQGADTAKAVLMFAEGVPLGADGLYWLAIRAANTFGKDKLSHAERVQWVSDNLEGIEASARDPLGAGSMWRDADEPWGFLATCHELAQAWALDNPAEFVSHLPIPQDGTCNGLQHLSAMGADPMGALATNLTASPLRHDIYQVVADRVSALVEADVMLGLAPAMQWVGQVSRAVVKRAVMTTPYGVTKRGIQEQLLADGHVSGERKNRRVSAAYLRDKIVEALGQTVASARDVMGWLQAVAGEMARLQVPFDWTSPIGSKHRMSYYNLAQTRVVTLAGKLVLWNESPLLGLAAQKMTLASAPNVIHSFDAAHLQMVINGLRAEGVTAFAAIHDSLGVHAAHTTASNAVLRSAFVDIYRDKDWLGNIEAETKARVPEANLPPRPAMGTFDVSEVRAAPFFFA